MKKRKAHPSLKSVYYRAFLFLIVAPLLVVLAVALLVLNRQFKRQAVENIRRAQENIKTELTADIDVMSMRLSHIIYTNNNEIITYASGTDTDDPAVRHAYEQKLSRAGNLALEPVKDVISVTFYMKDGRETFIKNEIHREHEKSGKIHGIRQRLQIQIACMSEALTPTPSTTCTWAEKRICWSSCLRSRRM